jgi:hypothetical protein
LGSAYSGLVAGRVNSVNVEVLPVVGKWLMTENVIHDVADFISEQRQLGLSVSVPQKYNVDGVTARPIFFNHME